MFYTYSINQKTEKDMKTLSQKLKTELLYMPNRSFHIRMSYFSIKKSMIFFNLLYDWVAYPLHTPLEYESKISSSLM